MLMSDLSVLVGSLDCGGGYGNGTGLPPWGKFYETVLAKIYKFKPNLVAILILPIWSNSSLQYL
jgi:hypothetical protein